jgi:hypothetical protein
LKVDFPDRPDLRQSIEALVALVGTNDGDAVRCHVVDRGEAFNVKLPSPSTPNTGMWDTVPLASMTAARSGDSPEQISSIGESAPDGARNGP